MPKDPKVPSATLDNSIRLHLGHQLRSLYEDPAVEKLPRDLARLAERVAQVIRAHTEPVDQVFIDGIMAALPSLRKFALSLTRHIERAEDLVQDTVLKALAKRDAFETGTNLQAWLFTILRNSFYSEHRKAGREVEDAEGAYAVNMIAIPDQEDKLALQDLSSALKKLPPDQRDALILVGADGMSYDDAAAALGVKVGTIKSRVNRARSRLTELMGMTDDTPGGSRQADL